MSPYHEPSTVSISWEMLRTYGRILLGARSSMKWRNTTRLVSVSLSFARDTQKKSRTSPNLGNYRRLPLWVWAGITSSTPYLHPTGGCLLPCDFKLSCGHTCRSLVRKSVLFTFVHFITASQCHADLDNHKSTVCYENCARLICTRQHPCVRLCHQSCGECEFPFSNVTLPCGHVEKQVPW